MAQKSSELLPRHVKYQVPMGEPLAVKNFQGSDKEMMCNLQQDTFKYFLTQVSESTGLIADKTSPDSPCSIAVVGLGISTYVVGVEKGWITREEAVQRILKILRFFKNSDQSGSEDATGFKGFYYHFLFMDNGRRMWESELSTIDTALMIAGILTAAQYFDQNSPEEIELRELSDLLYQRIDWTWALNDAKTLSHGWKPEIGFLPYRWDNGFSEAMILYALALGSPSHPISRDGYQEWISTFEWRKLYEIEHIYAGPLFIHQLSHVWLDFRAIHDDANRKFGLDYFQNSRRATYVQRNYAIENPRNFAHYSAKFWGITACDGPGEITLDINNEKRTFHDYIARAVPDGPDDGTVSPWVAVTSLPFAPEIVFDTVRHGLECMCLKKKDFFGIEGSFNPTFPERKENSHGWVSPWKFGLNEAPVILMIENFYSELIWNLTKRCEPLVSGLRRAGFTGGWLEENKKDLGAEI